MAQKKTLLSLAVGTAFAATASFAPLANAADNPFSMQKLSAGYQLAQADTKADMPAEKAKDGSCGADKKHEGNCGADKKKDGTCSAAKMKDGKCGNKKKDGKCGEGKCGANKKKMEEHKEEAK